LTFEWNKYNEKHQNSQKQKLFQVVNKRVDTIGHKSI